MPDFSDYIIFADESGDHGLETYAAEYPVFVLVFTLVRKQTYRDAVVPALQRMKMEFFGHDQVVFHERDIRKQLAPFGFLRSDAALREAFMMRMNEVVEAADFELFCAVIHKDRLKARYATPWNPYEIALLFCMEQVRERLLGLGQAGRRVHVIFEAADAWKTRAWSWRSAASPRTTAGGAIGTPTSAYVSGSH